MTRHGEGIEKTVEVVVHPANGNDFMILLEQCDPDKPKDVGRRIMPSIELEPHQDAEEWTVWMLNNRLLLDVTTSNLRYCFETKEEGRMFYRYELVPTTGLKDGDQFSHGTEIVRVVKISDIFGAVM